MELAWCVKCHGDVSLAHAVAEMPCPSCGSKQYFMVIGNEDKESLLLEFERMMRIGRWDNAQSVLDRCKENAFVSAADYNLSSANLEWRKQCAASASGLLSGGGVPLGEFRSALVDEFDVFVVEWLLREYKLIRLVPSDGSYIVEAV